MLATPTSRACTTPLTRELNPLASELTARQLHHLAMQRGEQVEIVPPPDAPAGITADLARE